MSSISMPPKGRSAHADEVTQAMERVLEADRDAARAIAEARERQQALISDAREMARRIEQRADERIRQAHRDCHAAVRAQIAQIENAENTNPLEAVHSREDLLTKAVTAIAARLTGEDSDLAS